MYCSDSNINNAFVTNKDPQFLPLNNSLAVVQPGTIEEIQRFIVGFIPSANSNKFNWPACAKVVYQYNDLINYSCVSSTQTSINAIAICNPCISSVNADQKVSINIQNVEPFIRRIGADHSSQRSGNGFGSLEGNRYINVFIVDTGISNIHPDLNVVGGVNFVGPSTGAWYDNNGHGTHVAGIVGAKDNTVGVVGVAPGVRLWAVKVMDANGSGFTSNIIAGLSWILRNRNTLWIGRAVTNMSFGGSIFSPLDDAVNSLINNGIVCVVAAGNQSVNAINTSPARVFNAITVGATEPNPSYTRLASYSNFGSIVDILAPGTNIRSTYPPNTYAVMSGTSMACPVVSGTAALLFSTVPIYIGSTSQLVAYVRNTILNNSAATSPKNYDKTTGSNPRILIPSSKNPTTNISVWAGIY